MLARLGLVVSNGKAIWRFRELRKFLICTRLEKHVESDIYSTWVHHTLRIQAFPDEARALFVERARGFCEFPLRLSTGDAVSIRAFYAGRLVANTGARTQARPNPLTSVRLFRLARACQFEVMARFRASSIYGRMVNDMATRAAVTTIEAFTERSKKEA